MFLELDFLSFIYDQFNYEVISSTIITIIYKNGWKVKTRSRGWMLEPINARGDAWPCLHYFLWMMKSFGIVEVVVLCTEDTLLKLRAGKIWYAGKGKGQEDKKTDPPILLDFSRHKYVHRIWPHTRKMFFSFHLHPSTSHTLYKVSLSLSVCLFLSFAALSVYIENFEKNEKVVCLF